MLSIFAVATIVLAISIFYPVYVYLVDQHDLRRFPAAHPLAALTDLWVFVASLSRRRYQYVEAAHIRLGPVVRLAPNHISFTDPAAFKQIHGHGVDIVKDDFYAHVAGGNPSMAQTTSRADHAKKRRWMSHVFSAREITAMEPRVMERVMILVQQLKRKSTGELVADTDEYGFGKGMRRASNGMISFDVRPWMNMLSYDAITAMFWSSCYNCLERGSDLVPASTVDGKTYQVHAMASFHGTTGFLVPLAQLSTDLDTLAKRILRCTQGRRSVTNFGSMVRYLVKQRMTTPPSQADLFSSMPTMPTAKHPDPVPFHEITAESTTMLDAGNDTTQTTLTNTLYLLSLNPEKQARLRQVLRQELAEDERPVASYQRLQTIPYLRAVIDESMRVRPPVRYGLPRTTVTPTIIAGQLIPAGVTISCPLSALHLSQKLFTQAEAYVPERWLPQSPFPAHERSNLRDFVLPFSLGGRACIGRNLAYMELSIVIAAVVLAFEWRLDEGEHGNGKGMDIVERLNANSKALWVHAQAL